ncbi:MAG: PD-(D/E)XK nuclease family protein [Opitutae bacterium]|nr:PD-(D/E)XK nuclease family protein [Opitutae bacterium]
MAEVPENVRCHFLPWHAPLLPQAVAWLARDWVGDGPLDLSRALVVVPTRQAGRRLRAGLAEHAAARGQAAFPPRVMPPEQLLALAERGGDVAAPLQTTLAWTHVLARVALADFRAVFPLDPPARGFAWTLRLAHEFTRLQATLGEAGLLLGDVALRAPADFPERERWQQLGELSRAHAAVLAERGWREPQAARLAAARAPAPLEGIERVVVLAVPDPLPLALDVLAVHARALPVDVVVFAPEAEAENFDAWGRPLADAWTRRAAPFADFRSGVHLLADAAAQAERIAATAARYPAPDGMLGIGVADAEIAALAENALERAGRAAFNPAGELHRAHTLFQFLAALAAFGRDPTFAHTLALARTPETLGWLAEELGGDFSAAHWLKELDDAHREHLPATLAQARTHAGPAAARGLARLADLRDELRRGDFASGAAAALARVFAGQRLDRSRAEDRRFEEAAQAWGEIVRACAEAARAFPHVRRDEWWEIALEQFGAARRETDKPAGALELQGWLELPWEDAPHVLVAGFNEGAVPESVVGDVFLPESLRGALGLKTNAARLARDAYLLHALVASRRAGGRVDVLLGKVSSAGDPLKPSRLLLQCADEELPGRVGHLFRPLATGAALPAWERPWKLRPRRAALAGPLSPTAFRSYLACPFRFYLQHVLKMEAVDAEKAELDVFDFGRLCHKPLEKFAAAPWRDCTDERLLAAMLVEEFDRVARERFGDTPAVPLVAQLESGRQRLRAAAKVQAQQRADGWAVFAIEQGFQIELGGLTIKGRIDRIDRHESGAWRVIDYKTSDAPKLPVEAHLGPPREGTPDWTLAASDGKPRQWTDLQLPLYLAALPRIVPEATERAACGYFNLPKAVASTSVALWDGYSIELHESALRCAAGVVAAVRAGEFWPPNEKIRTENDAFAELFHRGVAESVEGVGFEVGGAS